MFFNVACWKHSIFFFWNLFRHSPCFFPCMGKSFQMLLLLSSAPCALLVTDEKDSSESLWPCITKWTLMELNFLTALLNALTNFCFLECSNNFECNMLWLGMYIQFVWKHSIFDFLPISNLRHAVPWHDKSISILRMFNTFLNVQKFFKFWLKREAILSHGVLEVVATRHILRGLWGRIVISILKSNQIYTNFDKQAPKANEIF